MKKQVEELTATLAAAKGEQAKQDQQTKDLLRLRSEVQSLRQQTNALNRLREENVQLKAMRQASQKPAGPSSAEAPSDFPKENWVFAGYATPEAAVQTVAWAVLNGDINSILASVTPETKARLEALIQQGGFDLKAIVGKDLSQIAGYKIVEREVLSNDQIRVRMNVAGLGERNQVLTKVGNEWKFSGFGGK